MQGPGIVALACEGDRDNGNAHEKQAGGSFDNVVYPVHTSFAQPILRLHEMSKCRLHFSRSLNQF